MIMKYVEVFVTSSYVLFMSHVMLRWQVGNWLALISGFCLFIYSSQAESIFNWKNLINKRVYPTLKSYIEIAKQVWRSTILSSTIQIILVRLVSDLVWLSISRTKH